MSKPSPANEIIIHSTAGQVVRQRTRDTYIDATAMCQAVGKLFADYRRLKGTKAHLAALSSAMGIPIAELIQTVMGGNPYLQGTWVHPRVAVHLGQWLSVEFQVWVTGIIDDWREMQMLLRQEPTDWTKRFPDDFFEHICRLHGWTWRGRGVNPPQVVGHYINDLVWDRLALGLRQAIELRIPRLPGGDHRERMHQMLAAAVGIDALKLHLSVLMLHMAAASTWGEFIFIVNRVLPKSGKHLPKPPKGPPSDQGSLDL